jgi:hypothetical protein
LIIITLKKYFPVKKLFVMQKYRKI